MAPIMKVNISMMYLMVKVNINGPMETFTKELGVKVTSMEKVERVKLMVRTLMETGLKENHKVMENATMHLKELLILENGLREPFTEEVPRS